MLPVVVGVAFVAILIALVVLAKIGSIKSTPPPLAGISCQHGEVLAVHYHTHLQIIYDGTPVNMPSQVGIKSGCSYWLVTHDTSGIIHVEAPKSEAHRTFTLGDFFAVWRQPLGSKQVATLKIRAGQSLRVFVDGKLYQKAPGSVVLASHKVVVLEIGPSFSQPPPSFTWPASLPD
ncbi:MAG TPA: hypothetical protein VMU49_08050 [Candidatus Acidoferrales bacterium]|nr:hypothetical protein [Candidatus Acidoferrales bacterium]